MTRFFVKKSNLIKCDSETSLISHMMSAQYDGLVEVQTLGQVEPRPEVVPFKEFELPKSTKEILK